MPKRPISPRRRSVDKFSIPFIRGEIADIAHYTSYKRCRLTSLIEIGDAVKARRKALKLTQQGLARLAGVSLARVEGLENARLAEIGFKHLTRILNALGLDLRLTEQNQRRPTLEDLRAEDNE